MAMAMATTWRVRSRCCCTLTTGASLVPRIPTSRSTLHRSRIFSSSLSSSCHGPLALPRFASHFRPISRPPLNLSAFAVCRGYVGFGTAIGARRISSYSSTALQSSERGVSCDVAVEAECEKQKEEVDRHQLPELQLYNTLSKQKEVFRPQLAGKVSMYVCGVTSYDYSHIGHARVYVAFDVLFRSVARKFSPTPTVMKHRQRKRNLNVIC